jgi:outer membrane protein assembly factor BamB
MNRFTRRNAMRKMLVAFTVGLLTLAAPLLLNAFDWPQWRGPEGNGVSRETDWDAKALAGGPPILWKAKIGMGQSNIAVLNDRVYTVGSSLTVSCLDAVTGQTIWKQRFNDATSANASPAVDADGVYVLDTKGLLLCLGPVDGALRWKKDLVADCGARKPFYGFSASPVIEGNLLILTVNLAGMAIDKRTGATVWASGKPPDDVIDENAPGGVAYSTPVIVDQGGKKYAVICSYEGINAVETETGKLLWLYSWHNKYKMPQVADPLVFDNRLFIAQYYGAYEEEDLGAALFDISGAVPRLLWKDRSTCSGVASPVMMDGLLYVCQDGPQRQLERGSLRCFDVKRGVKLWEVPLEKRPISIIGADGRLLVLDEKGTLYVGEASAKGFKEISRCDVLAGVRMPRKFWTPPVLCNGRIYCKNLTGDLVCIDVQVQE